MIADILAQGNNGSLWLC